MDHHAARRAIRRGRRQKRSLSRCQDARSADVGGVWGSVWSGSESACRRRLPASLHPRAVSSCVTARCTRTMPQSRMSPRSWPGRCRATRPSAERVRQAAAPPVAASCSSRSSALASTLARPHFPRPAAPTAATTRLTAFERSPGFLLALLTIAGTSTGDAPTRQSAATLFKNVVKRLWAVRGRRDARLAARRSRSVLHCARCCGEDGARAPVASEGRARGGDRDLPCRPRSDAGRRRGRDHCARGARADSRPPCQPDDFRATARATAGAV